MKTACLVLVTFLCASLDCHAATEVKDLDGNQLLRYCNAAVQFMDSEHFKDEFQSGEGSFCFGYVMALLQSFQASRTMDQIAGHKDMQNFYPCFPEETGMSTGQAIRVIVKHLKDNPEKLHERAVLLSLAALQHAFPCKKS